MNEELKVIIKAETDKLKQGMSEGKRLIDKFGEEGAKKFAEFNSEVQKAGDVAKKSMAVAGAAIVGAATALLALSASTAEYRQNQAKLSAAFETAGANAEAAKDTYNDLYRVLGDDGQAVEAANHLAQLTTNEKDLATWTNICQGIYATFGDSLPIEGLTEAANETAKVGQVTGSLADALNWAGVSEDEFNEKLAACNTEAEREKLIRETLNGIYDDAAANYEEAAASTLEQNEAQAQLNEKMAALGEAMAPINTALTEFATKLLDELMPVIDEFMKNHGTKLEETLNGIAEAIGNVLSWIIDNWDLVSTIGAIVLGVAAALSVFSTVMGIVNAVMMASPVTWIVLGIVAAVAALVAIIVLVIKYWDEIAAAGVAAWEWLKSVFSGIASWIDENIIQPVANFFTGMWDGLKNGAKKAWEGVKSVFSSVASFFSNIFTKAWEGVKKVFSTGGKIFDGIKEGIVTAFKTVVNAIIRGINKVVKLPFEGLNKILGTIHGLNIAGVKPFSWLTWRAPVPQIPELAKGGIVDSATLAIIGERGKEAVMPLENNIEWMDMLAARLSERMNGGGTTPIILQVDGKVFAQTAINTINAQTKQTGRIGLNII